MSLKIKSLSIKSFDLVSFPIGLTSTNRKLNFVPIPVELDTQHDILADLKDDFFHYQVYNNGKLTGGPYTPEYYTFISNFSFSRPIFLLSLNSSNFSLKYDVHFRWDLDNIGFTLADTQKKVFDYK